MKKLLTLSLIIIFPFAFLSAQENDLLDIDLDNLDSIFDESAGETSPQEASQEGAPQNSAQKGDDNTASVISALKKRGIEFNASYYFKGAVNPGWSNLPWENEDDREFSWGFGLEVGASLDINAQISENFRVKSVISYGIPNSSLTLGDFFMDYNFFNRVFFRAGKFEQSWGVSPNFSFTNLLSRIATQTTDDEKYIDEAGVFYNEEKGKNMFFDPDFVSTDGTSYIVKLDVPIGIGGLQILALTRANIAGGVFPKRNFIGYGGKFNLAFRWADFNLGVFYQKYMTTRAYLSVKTNIFNTDFYCEGLIGINTHTDNSVGFAANFGITRSFFSNKLDINGEYFYEGEKATEYYKPETEFRKGEPLPFLERHNFALNILYKFGGKINPRLFTSLFYGDKSFRLIPGVRITPLPFIEVYLAIPVAFGDGYYYKSLNNYRGDHRPFSILLYVNFSGGIRASNYY